MPSTSHEPLTAEWLGQIQTEHIGNLTAWYILSAL